MKAKAGLLAVGIIVAMLASLNAHAERRSKSAGSVTNGALIDGFDIPLKSAYHRFYGPVSERGTHYATVEMAALLVRAAKTVHTALPGPPAVFGDCSLKDGGEVSRHVSHRSGRDVDVLLFVMDETGDPVTATGFHRFDRHGVCVSRDCRLQLDIPRMWWFVRTLLASQYPAVQYVFVSHAIRDRLIAYAENHNEHPSILERATYVLRQPGNAAPHNDHLHIRTYCAGGDKAAGCRDFGRRWSWVSEDGRAAPITR